MITADWVALGLVLVFAVLGLIFGFGKLLKFFTSGIFGIIISVFVCYLFLGIVLSWTFVQNLIEKFHEWLYSTGSVGTFFADIGTGKIVAAVILFIIVQIIRIICVKVLKSVMEIDNVIFKVINKTLGIVFGVAVVICLGLFFFQIMSWVGGETYSNFLAGLDGSVFGLDKLCENNPLLSIFASIG